MRISSLCSSSKANCTYIEQNGEGILVDIGCSFKALHEGLKQIDRGIENIRAVFITHEHTDHIAGLFQLTKNTEIPVFASEGTLDRLIGEKKAVGGRLYPLDQLSDAPISFLPEAFHTPHDSAESVGYRFTAGETRIAVCTDLGHVTEEVRANLIGCRFVLLESNYDPELLTRNLNYPPALKERIRSKRGHLSNGDSGTFARELIRSGTVSLLLGHLSPQNNTPELAYQNMIRSLAAIGAEVNRDYLLEVAAIRGTGKVIAC
ncbi:MAG: MBL fold metallo-hydrolase [Bacteroides sp.]|nr:MBL fold metallo-hydrolase [Eubacterium sp.]MCM1417152.1 MBL fold metallo-hydrolase [Roseburia sp.]MCM1461227.1 MBL fold metallo-hydrolase [Bacteroides sp.]